MGKAIAVLLAGLGLGLAVLLAGLDRGAVRGAAPAGGSDATAPSERADVVLRGAHPEADPRAAQPRRFALPAHPPLDAQAEPASAPRPPARIEHAGRLVAWYPNGRLEYESARTLAPNGVWLREGPWHAWHENGQLHERGAYHLGEEIGPWEWWYENGRRMAVGRFDAGEREGFWRYWHEDGALMTECTYRAGKAHGPWVQYHPSGFKTAEGRFENGELVGEWTVWSPDGMLNLDGTGVYAAGEKVGE